MLKKVLLISVFFVSIIGYGQVDDRKTLWLNQGAINDEIVDLPWKQGQISKLKNDTTYNRFMQSFRNGALWEVRKPGVVFNANPEILLGANYESESGKAFFTYGGGARFDYTLRNKLLLQVKARGYQQDATITDSMRGENNLYQGVYWGNYASEIRTNIDLRAKIAYEPSKYFHFESGIDNQFVGDGYHSILMGGYSAPYPYAMIATSFWKVNYNVQYHFLKDVAYPNLSEMRNKYLTTHQLNFKATPKLHFYIWEAVVWKQEDSVVQRGYDLSYMNPIIFFRPVEFQLGSPSPDNVLIGFGFRYQPVSWLRFYGQGLFDEFLFEELKARSGWWANKFAFQLGIGSRFEINQHSFQLLGEFNMARPFTYSHMSSMQNFGHKLYPLAHPLGANFGELLFYGRWQHKKVGIDLKLSATAVGVDENSENLGQNIYRSYIDRVSEYDHSWLQGNLQKDISADFRVNYMINKSYDLKISAGVRSYPNYYSKANAQQFNEVYVRLSTFLGADMKSLYRSEYLYE
jgi:hypothetical protein